MGAGSIGEPGPIPIGSPPQQFTTRGESHMPPAKKTATRRRAAARKSPARKEPAAVRRLNKSLDGAQEALAALRKDVSRDVSTGARGLYRDVEKFVKSARRDSRKLSTALQRDLAQAQKRLASGARSRTPARKTTTRKTATRKTATRRGSSRTARRSRRS
jgi:hypothetical protein